MHLSRPLILASASPRRAELLRAAGIEFTQIPSGVDEDSIQASSHEEFAILAAREKAIDVAGRVEATSFVLAADTIVCLDEHRLGKPRGKDDARRMLLALQGRSHEVITGIAVCLKEKNYLATRAVTTRVWFSNIPPSDLEKYLQTEEPYDKAGAYGIQGWASNHIAQIEGDYDNVVGLPVEAVKEMLAGIMIYEL